MAILEVSHLDKHYPSFELKDVSFTLESGRIIGFIGRNGAGKTTTLKCIYNLVKPDRGEILFQGESIREHEAEAKGAIGLLFGGIEYYPNQRLKTMTQVTSSFYPHWNQALYEEYAQSFGLDETKRIKELSSGMKVKYGLALALSHGAALLLLDEPTSGLDPVSRDELLDTFESIVSDGAHTILFSTHVISDLEKCADDIIYIKKGTLVADTSVPDFESRYVTYTGEEKDLDPALKSSFLYYRAHAGHYEGVADSAKELVIPGTSKTPSKLEDIMLAIERGNEQ
jgi:ABC-2 type transport system ATP-binding protein